MKKEKNKGARSPFGLGKAAGALAVVAIAALAAAAIAASSTNYSVDPAVVDQGGSSAFSLTYNGAASIGGAVVGEANSTAYKFEADWGYTVWDEDPGQVPVADPLRVMAGLQNPGPTNESSTAQDLVMMQIKLVAGPAGADVSSLTLTAYGSGDDAADVANVELYLDTDADGFFDPTGDIALSTGLAWSGDDGTVTFPSLGRSIPAGGTEHWIVVCDYQVAGFTLKTFSASIASPSDVSATDGTGTPITALGPPVSGGARTFNPGGSATGTLTVRPGPANPAHATAQPGQTAAVMQLQVSASTYESIYVQSLTVQASGTGNELTQVAAVNLFDDANGNGIVDPGETLIAGPAMFVQDDGMIQFVFNVLIPAGTAQTWIIAYDFAIPMQTDGQTFKVSLPGPSAVTAQGQSSALAVPAQIRPITPLTGPVTTIVYPPATEPAYFTGGCGAAPAMPAWPFAFMAAAFAFIALAIRRIAVKESKTAA